MIVGRQTQGSRLGTGKLSKWKAYYSWKGKQHHLGYFDTKEQAIDSRKKPYRFHGAKVDDCHNFNRYLKIVAKITGIIT